MVEHSFTRVAAVASRVVPRATVRFRRPRNPGDLRATVRIAAVLSLVGVVAGCGPSDACDEGFLRVDGTCVDLDECTTTARCALHRACTNTPGSFMCGACAAGYQDGPMSACMDVDECQAGTCGSNRLCTNTSGSYSCGGCQPGFIDMGALGCVDVDECTTNNGGCDPIVACTNTPGSVSCGACPAGYDTSPSGDCLRNDPSLSAISLGSATLLRPAFDPLVTEYELYLPSVTPVSGATATVVDPAGVAITLDGIAVTAPVALVPTNAARDAGGTWAVSLVVTAETGVSRTYTFCTVASPAPRLEARAPQPNANGGFGTVLDAWGQYVVVGVPRDDRGGVGVNPAANAPAMVDSGAVYVYARSSVSSDDWSLQATLKASNAEAGDSFGTSVLLTVGGDYLFVGAPDEDGGGAGPARTPDALNTTFSAGAVYVFHRVGSTWTQVQYLKAINPDFGDAFGASLGGGSASSSTMNITIGAPNEDSGSSGVGATPDDASLDTGAVYVYGLLSNVWTTTFIKAASPGVGDRFGTSLAARSGGLVVGAPSEDGGGSAAGAVYVFHTNGQPSAFSQIALLRSPSPDPGDRFGTSVALSDLDLVFVGAPFEDSNATGIGGDATNNGAVDSGAVFVFDYVFLTSAGTPQLLSTTYLKAFNSRAGDHFGVSIDADASTFAIGAPGQSGALASAAVGALTNSGAPAAGAAYFGYLLTSGATLSWTAPSFVKAYVPRAGDAFGSAVALSDPNERPIFVGAPLASDASSGLSTPGQASGSLAGAGALFFFH